MITIIMKIIIMIININNKSNSNDVMMKLITLKVSIFYYLVCEENKSACSKKKSSIS